MTPFAGGQCMALARLSALQMPFILREVLGLYAASAAQVWSRTFVDEKNVNTVERSRSPPVTSSESVLSV
jgi:hypothetical protein